MVVCKSGSDLKSKLSVQWDYMMEMDVYTWSLFTSHETALLIRSKGQSCAPSCDLPSQQYVVLSDFADKHRCSTFHIILRGPVVGCRVLQSLTHMSWPQLTSLALVDLQQLGAESISHLSDAWHTVTDLKIEDSFLDASLLLWNGYRMASTFHS